MINDNKQTLRHFLKQTVPGTATLASTSTQSASRTSAETRTKPNVVVIGADLGGLCCGAVLAKQGFAVTVIEQHYVHGGYAASFQRGRFNVNVSLHETSLTNWRFTRNPQGAIYG